MIFEELVRLQDDYAEKSKAANGAGPTSPDAIAKEAALKAYNDFKREMTMDFRVMLGCAAEDKCGALEQIVRAVVAELADRLDFDAVSAQAHHANVKLAECRMAVEDLKRDVEAMRKVIP